MSADQHQAVGQGHVAVRPVVPEEAACDLPSADMTRHAEAGQETGHVDPAAAGRWHQAQTELAGLIGDEARTIDGEPGADRGALPDSLADWMETRVAQLEETGSSQTEQEIESIG